MDMQCSRAGQYMSRSASVREGFCDMQVANTQTALAGWGWCCLGGIACPRRRPRDDGWWLGGGAGRCSRDRPGCVGGGRPQGARAGVQGSGQHRREKQESQSWNCGGMWATCEIKLCSSSTTTTTTTTRKVATKTPAAAAAAATTDSNKPMTSETPLHPTACSFPCECATRR
jgi:hypothetical protein